MQREVRAYVLDVIEACDAIELDVHGVDLDQYKADRQTRSAVEREFIIIGEAISVLRKLAPDVLAQVTQAQQIVDFRNQLTHGYMTVNDAIVWGVALSKAPLLRRESVELLARLDEAGAE